MAAFLGRMLAGILQVFTGELLGKLTAYIAKKRAEKAVEDAARASIDPLKNAKDGKAIDDASRDTFGKL